MQKGFIEDIRNSGREIPYKTVSAFGVVGILF